MINIKRTTSEPESLSNKSFEGVKSSLVSMQSNKCYLCESKNPDTTHIEHFIPVSKNISLKYEWSNLFLSCDHCNSVKNFVSDSKPEGLDLLNCSHFDVIISDVIQFICEPNPREKIQILPSDEHAPKSVIDTANLLDKIYNYESESLSFDAKMLTDKVIKEMFELLTLLHEYEYTAHSPERKGDILSKIRDSLSVASPFTAFKIHYILKRYPNSEFSALIPTFDHSLL